MDLLIKNGMVVTANEVFRGDIGIEGGKIALVGTSLEVPATTVVDAAGKYVLPGAIDAHTHLAMPFGSTLQPAGMIFWQGAGHLFFTWMAQTDGKGTVGWLHTATRDFLRGRAACKRR